MREFYLNEYFKFLIGVPCENTRDGGFICGPCPRNFTGNGVSCNGEFKTRIPNIYKDL